MIAKRQTTPLANDEDGEVHHIVPKAEGGSDDKTNLVKLSAREHYIAHLLLARIYNDRKMWGALCMMAQCRNSNRKYKVNSRLYAAGRLRFNQ